MKGSTTMKICMIVNNSITSDPRVKGEAKVLHNAGHDVTVMGNLANGFLAEELWEGIRFLRINFRSRNFFRARPARNFHPAFRR